MLALWLPIVVSTVALFFCSFLSWMIVRLHENDWLKIDNEDRLIETVRDMNIPEGNYMFPGSMSPAEMNSPEYREKYKSGPRGTITVLPETNMAKNLVMTVVYFLFCNATFAYLASFALDNGTDSLTIFRFVATVALLTFSASYLQHAIWFRSRVVGHVIEAIAFSLIAGAIFTLLWPT